MYAYTWRMWHNTTAKYYENVENGVSRCLPCSLVKCLPCSLVKCLPYSLVKCLLYEFYPGMGCGCMKRLRVEFGK